jgi:LmbE family N-acetylglucosaminyl deacetylase
MATHNRICRTCRIDFDRLDTVQDDAVVLARLARVIVHEATHGHLDSKHVAHSRKNRDRIEKICIVEEHRFMRLLGVSDDGWCGTVDEQVQASALAETAHQAMSLRAKVKFVRDRFR